MSTIEKKDGYVIVTPESDIIASQYQVLQKELSGLIDEGVDKLVVDLKDIDIIDSAGLGVFISAQNSLRDKSGKLELINVSKYVMKLFKIMRLDQHFSVNEKE